MGHGVEISEVPTGVTPPVSVTAGLPVYVGTAPINLGDPTLVNKPAVFYALADAVKALGPLCPSSQWRKWTLHEAVSAHFVLYGVGPIVVINVIDPANHSHYAAVAGESHVLDASGNATLKVYGDPGPIYGVLLSTVVVKVGGVAKVLGTDYTLAFDANGFCVVSRVAGGAIGSGATITVDYHYLDPSGVVASDVIGGYTAGVYTGIQVADLVYPALRLVPGFLLAPKWSEVPTVAAALITKAHAVSGAFRAHAVVDLSSDPGTIASFEAAAAWKTSNGLSALDASCCWPLFANGPDVYHLSTHLACLANVTDAANNGIPFAGPSNKALVGGACQLDDGTPVLLTKLQANALNAQGIVTAINSFYGWRLWGNRTAIYPGSTDPKDAFLSIRRMFNWIGNTIILTTDRDVDEPGNKRLIASVVGTIGSFINGLVALGALVDGKIEFRKDENPTTDLSDGKIRFHVTLTPPSPAESLQFVLEYDPAALAALFS